MDTFKDRLSQVIKTSHLSKAEISRRCRVSRATVTNWESGLTKDLKTANLDILCSVLGCDRDWLLYGKQKSEQTKPPEQPEKIDESSFDKFGLLLPEQRDEVLRIIEDMVSDNRRKLEELRKLLDQ